MLGNDGSSGSVDSYTFPRFEIRLIVVCISQ